MAHYTYTLLNMFHKILYVKYGVLDWYRNPPTPPIPPSSINKKIDYIFEI